MGGDHAVSLSRKEFGSRNTTFIPQQMDPGSGSQCFLGRDRGVQKAYG